MTNDKDARIAALEAQLAEMTIRIKPLEWKELSTGWIAHTSFHAYEVVKTDHGFMATYANRDFAWGTEDAMKVAAQADYERRILSALEATPPTSKVTDADMDDAAVAALVALARHNIPTDIQELLVRGDPMRSIPPGALPKSFAAAIKNLTAAQEEGKP